MSAFSGRELRAIRSYCDEVGAVAQLSVCPIVRMLRKRDEALIERHIDDLLREYDQRRAEASTEAVRRRKLQENK